MYSAAPFCFCLQSFPESGFFSNESALRIRWPKHQSFSFSVSPSNEYSGLIPLGLTGLIFLQSKGLSSVFSSTTIQKHQFFGTQPFLWSNSHIMYDWKKTITLIIQNFVGKVISLLFNMISRLATAFPPRNKSLLISCLQPSSTVILEPKRRKSVTVSTFSFSICQEVMGPDVMILVFLMLSFKPAFSLSSFTLAKRLFSSYSLTAIRVVSSAYLRLLFLMVILNMDLRINIQ